MHLRRLRAQIENQELQVRSREVVVGFVHLVVNSGLTVERSVAEFAEDWADACSRLL